MMTEDEVKEFDEAIINYLNNQHYKSRYLFTVFLESFIAKKQREAVLAYDKEVFENNTLQKQLTFHSLCDHIFLDRSKALLKYGGGEK